MDFIDMYKDINFEEVLLGKLDNVGWFVYVMLYVFDVKS